MTRGQFCHSAQQYNRTRDENVRVLLSLALHLLFFFFLPSLLNGGIAYFW